MATQKTDWLIVGGGVVGLLTARKLREKFPSDSIVVLEKEPEIARHASGRNSGVLHAGIYYAPGSLKARLCLEGRKAMADYCEEYKLPINKAGKIIIPTVEGELREVERLYNNAKENGVNVELFSGEDVHKYEPRSFCDFEKALYSPDTMVVSPKLIMKKIADHLVQAGIDLQLGNGFSSIDTTTRTVTASNGDRFTYGYMINAAGGFADKVAHLSGFGEKYTIFPFRGVYFQLNPNSPIKIKTNIYPVPDKRVPFLGVHFTPNVDGDMFIGPTAMPTLGREHYSGLTGIDFDTIKSAAPLLLKTYFANHQGMRNLVHQEMRRLVKALFIREAQKLVPSLSPADVISCSKRGIRAQLFDLEKNAIEMDFVVESDAHSLHVLNAVSPAFTCGFSFARHLVEEFITNRS